MKKMADIDIDPFSDHDKTGDLTPGGVMGRPTLEPECKQETSFGGMSLRTEELY